jgi:hypothetical protein
MKMLFNRHIFETFLKQLMIKTKGDLKQIEGNLGMKKSSLSSGN